MKKVLLLGGIALAGFGLFRYFKYQIDLALNYDYKIKNFKIVSYDSDKINANLEIEVENKDISIELINLSVKSNSNEFTEQESANVNVNSIENEYVKVVENILRLKIMKNRIWIFILFVITAFGITSCNKSSLSTEKEKYSYVVGFQYASKIKKSGIDFDEPDKIIEILDDENEGIVDIDETEISPLSLGLLPHHRQRL
jgi:hypothetical protein